MNPWVIVLAAAVCAVGFVVWDRPKDVPDDDRDAAQQQMREWLNEGRRDE